MSAYLVDKFKGIYRILPNLNTSNTDFARNIDGSIDEDNIYIKCAYNCKIMYYGNGILIAYIPSLGRAHNIKKAIEKDKVEIVEYDESSEEAMIKFKVKDIEYMAGLLKPNTSGAGISPFSPKNLKKNDEIKIPDEDMNRYKAIINKLEKKDITKIRNWNADFLTNVLQKKIRKETKNRKYDYKEDAKQMNLSRQIKEFVYAKGLFEEYMKHIDKMVSELYNNN